MPKFTSPVPLIRFGGFAVIVGLVLIKFPLRLLQKKRIEDLYVYTIYTMT